MFSVTSAPLGRDVAVHCDDSVCNHKMRANGCADIENAFVDSGPMQEVFRPAVAGTSHDAEHIFHAQSDARPVMRLHFWH